MKKYYKQLFLLFLCFLVVLGACSNNEENEGDTTSDEGGGEFFFGLDDEPNSLEPETIDSTSSRTVKLAIYRGLFGHEGGEVTPELVDSYDTNDDKTSYTFKLKDAKFHNGDEVTADDVKYTFDRILS